MELFKLFGTIAVNNDQANSAIDETTNNAEESEGRMSSAFKKIGAAVATYFAAEKIIAFGREIVNVAAEVSAEASAFDQIMGEYSDEAAKKVDKIADATGMVATRLTPYMTSMTAKFKGLGYDIDDATDLASSGLNIAADAAAFWDKSLDESMSHLNSFINGSYEGGEAIGLFANDTQMASYAVEQGIVSEAKEWANLNEAIKQATRLEYAEAMFEASGAVGQAAKESDQYANVQANLTEKWRKFKAQIGEPVLQNIVLPAMEKLSKLVDKLSDKFQNLSTWVKDHQTLLELLGAVIVVLTTAITAYTIAQNAAAIATGVMTAASTAFGAVMAFITSPITLVVAAIGTIIAVIVLCIKHWDQIKEKVSEVVESIKTKVSDLREKVSKKFDEIRTKITEPIEKAREKVRESVDKIKGFFDNLKLKLPSIKLPHFNITGKLSLSPPSVPKLSINWYAKAMSNAMLLDSPTIFGMSGGKLLGGGEAGQEVVSGSNTLMNMIRGAVKSENEGIENRLERLISMLADFFPEILLNMGNDIVLNDGVLVGRIAPAIDLELGNINELKGRGTR